MDHRPLPTDSPDAAWQGGANAAVIAAKRSSTNELEMWLIATGATPAPPLPR